MAKQAQLIAAQLRELADKLETEPNIQIRSSKYSQATVPGEPSQFTGMVKLSLEAYVPSLRRKDE